ncbi:MAG: hypothetical protein CR988_06795 [Treponema sp.]|nr:MAG: hypothetical protein CR988_06795 [Treponema sp.]
MKNRAKSFTALILFFLILLTSCGPRIVRRKRKFHDVSWVRIQVEGKLKVGIINSLPPFIDIDSKGKYTGFDVELAKAVGKKLNMDVEFKVIKWNNKKKSLYENEIDCIWSGFNITRQNITKYNFTEPYIKSAQVITVRDDKNKIKTPNDVKKRAIAGLTSSTAAQGIRMLRHKYGDFSNFKFYPDLESMIEALKNKEVDAIISDVLIMYYQIKSGVKFKTLPEAIVLQEYGIAFRNGEDELKRKIEAVLVDLEREGVVEELARKWFGANICLINK